MGPSILLLLSLTCSLSLAAQRTYTNYKVLTVHPTTVEQLNFLVNFQRAEDSSATGDVDFWNFPQSLDQDVTLAVSSSAHSRVVSTLEGAGLTVTVVEDNLQNLIEEEERENTLGRLRTGGFNLNIYHRHAEINQYLDNVASNCSRCEVFSVGQSYEGRDMKVIKIGALESRVQRPAFWIDAGIHAREWIAPATAINMIDKLIHLENEDEATQNLMNEFDWYILPSVNPDGYEYSHTDDRFWRKTRRPNRGSPNCVGTDPNRNWDFHWMETGASDNPCSQIFAGPRPFSERETKNVAKFLKKNKNIFKVYLSFHSFGQYWLTPWGYTSDLPDDYDDLEAASNAAAAAINEYSGKTYTVGSSTNVLYAAAGSSFDWAKGVTNIKYSFTVELRDLGRYGFVLPDRKIMKQGVEMWQALKATTREISNRMMEVEESGRRSLPRHLQTLQRKDENGLPKEWLRGLPIN